MKKVISLFLVIAVVLNILPTATMSAQISSGSGWSFNAATGTLTVSSDWGTFGWRTQGKFHFTDIKTLIVTHGVTTIKAYSYYNCTELTTATIPETVETIENNAFQGCVKLTTLNLASRGLKSIGSFAFQFSSLTSITIPDSVRLIDYYALWAPLETVFFLSSTPPTMNSAFGAWRAYTVYVPIGAKAAYEATGKFSFDCEIIEINFDLPTPPRRLKAIAGDGRVTLSWAAPASSGNSPILRYEVSSNNGISWITASSNSRHMFEGLTNGASYVFQVRAVNRSGKGVAATAYATPKEPAPCERCPICVSGEPPILGHILGGSVITISDALEILKNLVGMENRIDDCVNALNAALIVANRPTQGMTTISDALEILKKLVGIASVLDNENPIITPSNPYKGTLQRYVSRPYVGFAFADVNNDGIDEFFVISGASNAEIKTNMYTIIDGTVVFVDTVATGHSQVYLCPNGGLYEFFGHMGEGCLTRIFLENGIARREVLIFIPMHIGAQLDYTEIREYLDDIGANPLTFEYDLRAFPHE